MRVLILLVLCLFISKGFSSEKVVIADFEDLKEDTFPAGWGIKKGMWYTSGEGNKAWKVSKENFNKYLSCTSKADSFTIGKEQKYNLEKYKILKWKWRVHEVPEGGNESKKETGDSAAGVYVVFPGFIIPYAIKYVWSSSLKEGTILDSPFTGRTKIVVVRSGKTRLGKWIKEERNVYEDYLKVFDKKELDKNPKVIGFLTDSDNTGKSARADYDDIYIETLKE